MNARATALWFASLALSATGFAQGFGNSQLIRDWRFHIGEDLSIDSLDASDVEWNEVTTPHDWSVAYPASPDNASCTGYLPGGIGWYKTTLNLDASSADRKHYLYFEGVYNRSEVFVNGQSVGYRPNGYVSFLYDITPHLNARGPNELAVRVDHSQSADSRWYTGSGIYRPVHLVTANQIHIGLWGNFYQSSIDDEGNALVTIETEVVNHLPDSREIYVKHRLLDPAGKSISDSQETVVVEKMDTLKVHAKIEVPDPQLWSVRTPNLYTLQTVVEAQGTVLDISETKVGIRSIEFDPNRGFALNGEWMKVKGVCLHHDAGVLGAAVPKAVWRERLLQLKKLGCNAIRMSHNPQATDLYDLCDELGFLVMDEAFDEWEFPKKKWLVGWNKGEPGFQGSADFFHEWGERDLEAMVKRDRNHPSIIMWSIGNEVDYPNDPYSHPILDTEGIGQIHTAGYKKNNPSAERLGEISQRLAAAVRWLDTSRPVTAALAGAIMSNQTSYPDNLDIVGYNYTENRYQIDHEAFPSRVLFGSENRHDLEAWKAVSENDFIFGQFIWTGFDYLGESGPWPSRGFTTGLIDLANNIKPRGHFRRALWSEEPVAYLGTYPNTRDLSMDAPARWDYEPGQIVRVVCYTNGDEAELFLDGKSIAPRKPHDPKTAIIHWDVPFQAGQLKVVSYLDGKPVATSVIEQTGFPKAISATANTTHFSGAYDVAVLTVSITDKNGRRINTAQSPITCSIEGPGKLLGLENASRDASENLRDNIAPLLNGSLVAYVQSTASSGEIEITFSSPEIDRATIVMPIHP